ncbi:pyridine nucleotide-disulfide oxidoreductase-domain-containing protein [Lasiosphaeria miniovina]|uniref:Pyridine nucleotide-disulfide oxidoreductase-domain-containing protein n=1 Tax=Lasiosphaeria miniovina TaxID=1954250 RepID=A0AA40DZK6_9PEZI|nr:pyridine nucleotide-disulfide oxidoreductase-domain-containing protein [Lasiosphaeria miniovina]KAK0722419.1 pyridine nucleotide-disulfide oxidoreductase-domain-containing protein [Lasiosphaeria miniovina]
MESSKSKSKHKKERVVILGSGWAGYAVARTLDPAKYERVVVSPRSYFVFTPLLASTSVGTLEFRTILEPVRRLPQVDFFQGWADDVDFDTKMVRVEVNTSSDMGSQTVIPPPPGQATENPSKKGDVFDLSYDKLVIACGSYSQTFGIEGVRQHAHFLRDIGDARRIRLRVLSLFELCSYPSGAGLLTDDDKRTLLHFAIVGGGPTGIEFAAELHDLIYDDLARLYPDLLRFVRIAVYDVAPKVLPMFDQALAKYAMDTFARHGIDVRTEHHLERLRPADGDLGSRHGALRIKVKELGDDEVGAGLVVWSTGLMQNPLVAKLTGKKLSAAGGTGEAGQRLATDVRTGGLVTDAYLRARTTSSEGNDSAAGAGAPPAAAGRLLEDVFVIGDCAILENDPALPKTAQVASQQAIHLAKRLNRGDVSGKPFAFRNWGTLTYLGSWKAIHQSSADELKGWVAWVIWRGAYLTKSMSVRNKILVPVYWAISWLFGRGISRF